MAVVNPLRRLQTSLRGGWGGWGGSTASIWIRAYTEQSNPKRCQHTRHVHTMAMRPRAWLGCDNPPGSWSAAAHTAAGRRASRSTISAARSFSATGARGSARARRACAAPAGERIEWRRADTQTPRWACSVLTDACAALQGSAERPRRHGSHARSDDWAPGVPPPRRHKASKSLWRTP